MAARPTWQGHLKLSLVTCPVALYTATSSSAHVSFHLINPDTNNRIRMVPTDPDTGPIERSDLVKGYEVAKDEYVLFDDADFDKVKLETTRTICIDSFVDEDEIDRLYWSDPFYVVPEKGVGVEAFAVIRDAMKSAGKIAIGTLVLRGRERQLALEVRDKGLVAYSLRAHDEVRAADDYFDDIPAVRADKDMVEIASRIIAQKETDFDPSIFKDRYDDALRDLRGLQGKSVEHRADLLYLQGYCHHKKGDVAMARSLWTKMDGLDPNNPWLPKVGSWLNPPTPSAAKLR